MIKKSRWLIGGAFLSLSLSPLAIVACASTIDVDAQNLQLLLKQLALPELQPDVNKVILNPIYETPETNNGQSTTPNLVANDLNMFRLLLNDENSATEDDNKVASLNSVFQIKPVDFAFETSGSDNQSVATKRIEFSFIYNNITDSTKTQAKPYLINNKKAIMIPVLTSLVDLKTNQVLATKFIDYFALQIRDNVLVNNNKDLGFNGLPGKQVVFTNQLNGKIRHAEFQAIPNEIIDNYLDFQSIPESDFQIPVIYDFNSNKWRNKTFAQVKTISGAIKNPLNKFFQTGTTGKEYSYSILDSGFDQNQWEYPRFVMRFQPANLTSITEANAKLYGLLLNKKYTYVDERFQFLKPTSSEISTEKSKNDTLASNLAKEAEDKSLYLPIVNFTRQDVQEFGVDKIIEFFNRNKQQFLPPEGFNLTILGDDQREIWFEIPAIRKNDTEAEAGTESVIAVDVQLNVARKDLQGSATFTKKFDTSLWKWL